MTIVQCVFLAICIVIVGHLLMAWVVYQDVSDLRKKFAQGNSLLHIKSKTNWTVVKLEDDVAYLKRVGGEESKIVVLVDSSGYPNNHNHLLWELK